MVKKNDQIRLTVERLGSGGEGVAHLDGQVVFVAGGLPGEVCDVHILKVGKTALWSKVAQVVEPSPHRQDPDCPHYPRCGGCQLRHMSYALELESKRQRVEDCLRRIGGVDLPVSVIFGAENTLRYRNKVQLPVADGPAIGFFQARSHRVVDVADCLLQPEAASRLCAAVRTWMTRYGVPAYDEGTHGGLLRHLFLRFAGARVLCCLVVNGHALPEEAALVEALRAAEPELAGVVLSENTRHTNVILGGRQRVLWGEAALEDTLCAHQFRISVPSFYQVNHAQTEVLYAQALDLCDLTGTETALDLYCGIGTITLALARRAGRVIGAEVVPAAVEDARQNARRNGVENVTFLCADAGEAARQLADEGLRPDVVCVDPPRKGLDPGVVDTIVDMAPRRVVYVSCDPATLARDVKRFGQLGYAAQRAVAVDLFPRTSHIECVIKLCRVEK